MRPNLTFDTSCVVSLLGKDKTPKDEYLALIQLRIWNDEGKIKIWKSEKSVYEAEEESADNSRDGIWLETLNTLGNFDSTDGGFVIGISKIGIDTHLVPDEIAPLYIAVKDFAISNKVKNKKIRGAIFDSAILLDHIIQGNDVFVSRDKFHLSMAGLVNSFEGSKTMICNPKETVNLLKSKYKIS